ncbi:MAG: cysteine--tRNA ligase [Nitrospirales bacterium]|nr:cysteine--tRNA ligase [Nitrospira sp.]MDR4501265.1 cysteine--tRNA ligase [Nitrospirales bacterium]
MKIFNSLTGKKEEFTPLEGNHVRMYVCGVTVYDECHLGHARSAVVFDLLYRYLRYIGYFVTYVRNFTDVDDKILKKAKDEGVDWKQVVRKYIDAYYRDMNRLRISTPEVEPRATEHMQEIIEMIARLIEKGYAYQVDSDVYYEVSKYDEYGRLSGRKKEEMLAGARVEVDERKRDPMDFALWKAAKPGEPGWESPWGPGRPGWHIECSAMSLKHLGNTFDIHGGGKDLVFPHHENEIAQSCADTGQEFANYWVHNGFVTIDQEKMSKSLGNFFTIREIFEKLPWRKEEESDGKRDEVTSEVMRYFLLSTHYRSDLNFSDEALYESKSALDNVYRLFEKLKEPGQETSRERDQTLEELLAESKKKFVMAMDNDLNTPRALAEFQGLRGGVNKLLSKGLSDQARKKVLGVFRDLGKPLGLFQLSVNDWKWGHRTFEGKISLDATASISACSTSSDEWIEQQIKTRLDSKKRKDFATADKIRQDLAEQGIILEDRPDGTTRWKR